MKYKEVIFHLVGYSFIALIVLYNLTETTVGENPKHALELKNMDSIIKYQKTQLDTLMWYNEIGFKLKDK